jgi:hypothetical protein
MDDDEEFDSEEPIPSRRMTPLDLLIHVMTWLTGMFHLTAEVADSVAHEMGAHNNWRVDQRNFAEEARAGMEKITEGAGG